MSAHRYTVELRISGLDPMVITADLKLSPCQTWAEGIERHRGRAYPNMWAYNGTEHTEYWWNSLNEGIEFMLSKLWSYRQAISDYKERGARLIWWCGHFYSGFDGGPSLPDTLLSRLGEFGAELFIDNYHECAKHNAQDVGGSNEAARP